MPADRRFRPGRAWALASAVALLLAAPGCHTARSFKERATTSTAKLFGSSYDDPMAEAKLARAEEMFTAGQHDKAQDQFRAIIADKLIEVIDARTTETGDAGPVIDRSGGPGGKRRLPVSK